MSELMKMDFTKIVKTWEELQLRILVLASLFIQCFLFVSAPQRKRRIPGLLRFFIWLAYLGSDAVAIYALTTLSGSQEKDSHPGPQVLWVPILLVHLGGQEAITAYNIEDNELWRRHVLTAVFKVTVAINVFVKYYPWSSSPDIGIFVPGLLLFLCGITKCVCKPWDLKRVSINSLVDDSSGPAEKGEIDSLHEYLRAAMLYVRQADHGSLQPSDGGDGACKVDEVWKPYNLCVDVAPPYPGRLSCLRHLVRNQDEAHRLVQSGLSATFDRLYTKESLKLHDISPLNMTNNVAMNRWKILTSAVGIRTVAALVLLWAIGLFYHSSSHAYNHIDVTITYALLWSALVMECAIPAVMESVDKIKRWRLNANRWPDQVAQYNLVGYLARNRKHSWLMKMATCLVGTDLLDQRWCMESSKSSHEITKLVHGHVAGGWTEGHIADAEAFRAFNDCRGQWTLDKEEAHTTSKHLRSSVSRPFDESVLLWHLATDFCFHLHRTASSCEAARRRSREMSNYMAYLLFVNPEMLMPGARRSLFRAAYGELADMLEENPRHTPRDEAGLAHKVIQLVKRDTEGTSIVHQAWSIAEDLMDLCKDNDEKMWRVIQGVWVEMLCFSASRCRGYLHAKSLGTGGEYLSYVWLLLLYMGMETLSEKMQRTELYEDCTAAGRTSAAATANNDQNV
ncbi:hypothetical protein SETIT_8G158600v2 [Setaria italica]|uniref:DUF4220 domain-containing protein n=1 Tax=Setaria italica TaxID=4555 RepID=K3ZHL2_SETIT|nr:uncharacterized protein LOC101782095 [Setaria italica]RCV38633.1 hypothetical protein SETIT_8G158600v2 [Setaria italica]